MSSFTCNREIITLKIPTLRTQNKATDSRHLMFTLCASISIQQKGDTFFQEKMLIKEWGEPTGSILWTDNQQFCVKKPDWVDPCEECSQNLTWGQIEKYGMISRLS